MGSCYKNKMLLRTIAFVLLATVASQEWMDGTASCYGNYVNDLANPQSCGLGSWITGENWVYTSAICHNWNAVGSSTCNSCYEVKCSSGNTANMGCAGATTKVKIVDTLASSACSSGHVFDLSDVPYTAIATENGAQAGCSGSINVQYRPVSCDASGLVTGGIKIGLLANQVDPWQGTFYFSNVGGSGALKSVMVSNDGGTTWHSFTQTNTNGARWDGSTSAAQGAGTWLNNKISFKLETCALSALPQSCDDSGEVLEIIDALPSDWCGNTVTPCALQTFQVSQNFGTASGENAGIKSGGGGLEGWAIALIVVAASQSVGVMNL